MAALPYMQLYVAEYLADAAHLTTIQHGAYLLLLMNYWQRGKPLKNSNERLANVARMSNDEWEQHCDILAEFFTITDEEWIHGRIERDLALVRAKSAKASASGRASANKRSTNVQRTLNKRPANAKETSNHLDTDTDTDKEKKKSAIAPVLPDWLDKDAWQTWVDDRKERGKKLTKAAIKKQIEFLAEHKADHAAILDKSVRQGWAGLFPLRKDDQQQEAARIIKDFPA